MTVAEVKLNKNKATVATAEEAITVGVGLRYLASVLSHLKIT